jgi:cytochrome c
MRVPRSLILSVAAAALVAGCSKSGGSAEAPAGPAPVDPAVASLPAPFNTADVEHGKVVFAQCRSCHTIAKDGPNMVGPNLHGLFGRKAAVHPDFKYSDALKAQAFAWDAAHLDSWLKDPRVDIPGTKMTFVGLAEPKDRIDVIGFLKVEAGDTAP